MAKLIKGVNDIATLRPEWIQFFVNKEDAYNHTTGSGRVCLMCCPNCGYQREFTIYKLKEGFRCINCINGISFPEKLFKNILDLLGIKYKYQYSPKYISPKRYDFYLTDYDCIVEINGRHHYENSEFGKWQKIRETDMYKYDMAIINGYEYNKNYFVVDARKADFDYIMNNIENSNITKVVDLSKIDYQELKKCSTNTGIDSLKYNVCKYWKENSHELMSAQVVADFFNIHKTTAIRYLKHGTALGWCHYNPQHQILIPNKKRNQYKQKIISVFFNGEKVCECKGIKEFSLNSERLVGTRIPLSMIHKTCKNEYEDYKGFTFEITKQRG